MRNACRCIMLLLVTCLFGVNSASSQECRDNQIITGVDAAIYVSDFRVSLQTSDCPGDSINLSEPIVVGRNQPIQFWFRLQGTEKYLNSGVSTKPYDVRFFRLSGNSFAFFGVIRINGIDLPTAAAEAKANEGHFDWRIWVRKKVFFRPGIYSLALYQGDTEICFREANKDRVCAQEFKVE